jgi:peptidoglycan hydrolase CwlO-like protein
MNTTNNLLDSLDKVDVNVVLIDGKISENLKDMDAMIDNDSVSVKDFYQNIVAYLSELHAAKKELREATSKDANLGELKQQISQLKDDLARSENNVVILQTQLAMQRRD